MRHSGSADMGSLRVVLGATALAALLAIAASCSSSSSGNAGSNTDAAAGDDSSSSSSGSGSSSGAGSSSGSSSGGDAGGKDATGSSSGTSGDSGSDGADGAGPITCTTFHDALCDEIAMCDPTGLQLLYGDVATCKADAAQACAAPPIPDTNGVIDLAACLSAFTTTCDSYFESTEHVPAPCLQKAGTIANGATGCGYDQQCVAGDNCNLSGAAFPDPRCMQGTCAAAITSGNACTTTTDCDAAKAGLACVATATGTPPTSDGNTVCQTVLYGNAGAPCVAATNKQCKAAYYCGPNNTCVAKLGAGQPCNQADGSCDDRVHLSCLIPSGGGAAACTAPTLLASGAQCGGTTGGICDGNLYCDTTTTPSTCKPKVAMGGGCVTTTVGECAYGLTCSSSTSTCQPPPAAVCM